jgi:hypothetical protein
MQFVLQQREPIDIAQVQHSRVTLGRHLGLADVQSDWCALIQDVRVGDVIEAHLRHIRSRFRLVFQ